MFPDVCVGGLMQKWWTDRGEAGVKWWDGARAIFTNWPQATETPHESGRVNLNPFLSSHFFLLLTTLFCALRPIRHA